MEGETLADRLARGPLTLDEALTRGHRDRRCARQGPSQGRDSSGSETANVMLTGSGPKLLDFGLAKSHGRAAGGDVGPHHPRHDPRHPAVHGAGTVRWRRGRRRTDIFAFGVVLHEMVTGKKAFEGKSQVLLISAIATATPPPVSRVQLRRRPRSTMSSRRVSRRIRRTGGRTRAICSPSCNGLPRWRRRGVLRVRRGGNAQAAMASPGRACRRSRSSWPSLRCPPISTRRGPLSRSEVRFRVPRNLDAQPWKLRMAIRAMPLGCSARLTARFLRTGAPSCFVPGKPRATLGSCTCGRSAP